MSREKLTRKKFEEIANQNELFKRTYFGALGGFEHSYRSWNTCGSDIIFSPEETDYQFCRDTDSENYTCMTRLWHSGNNARPITIPYNKGLGHVLVGAKLIKDYGDFKATIGCTISEKSLEEELKGKYYSDGFWPWDEILIKEKKGKKKGDGKVNAEIWQHGETPVKIEWFISRGILDSIYQPVLETFKIPQGRITVRYSGGRRPVPVLYPGFGQAPWIGM
ncbi:MAG: hypothetical protein KKB21_04650 [Nanoarchaeota archaeon]|nr:hypothetical protein [Nanoarchaeota archaeon]MBU4086836.1 hypothetical protein [Nanoarchaeota archaeon]